MVWLPPFICDLLLKEEVKKRKKEKKKERKKEKRTAYEKDPRLIEDYIIGTFFCHCHLDFSIFLPSLYFYFPSLLLIFLPFFFLSVFLLFFISFFLSAFLTLYLPYFWPHPPTCKMSLFQVLLLLVLHSLIHLQSSSRPFLSSVLSVRLHFFSISLLFLCQRRQMIQFPDKSSFVMALASKKKLLALSSDSHFLP